MINEKLLFMQEYLPKTKGIIFKIRQHFCMKFHTTILVVKNEELSPQEEPVQDIISILHVFSCRLYGLRKYKKQIEKDEEIAEELQDRDQSYRRAEDQNT